MLSHKLTLLPGGKIFTELEAATGDIIIDSTKISPADIAIQRDTSLNLLPVV
ncbi:MAG: hypothetical protein WAU25_02175 [Nitrososphaeraceae archaeon]